ncbi:MAG: hypothetical protein AB1782_07885 [Cyanobacteriota bacterium]
MSDWNYKITSKKIVVDIPDHLSLNYFENKLKVLNTIMLKWAIISVLENKYVIYATYLKREE